VCTCQKCIRTGDIDNVGKTARHLTFFEMLGNYSFGDYFKREAIHWTWEYLTDVLGLSPDRLYPSIYGEDEEAFSIWHDEIGIDADRITRFYRDPETGECDNFWEHGAGPCGPCSEVYYDRGEKYGCGKPTCGVGCDCDRYMEVWNDVFTQFDGDGKGNYTELEQKNIDTGMGLERLAVVMQDVDSVFDIDTMKAIRDAICTMAKKTYQADSKDDVSIRLITDHIRSATFMVSDGVLPSNEGRGYVLRRLIRRAARHGRMLGIEGLFLAKLSETVITESADGYPELAEKREFIPRVLSEEEEKFNRTIDQGLAILADMEEEMAHSGEGMKTLSGENAFKLYDTYGFPLDLTEEILAEKGFLVDREGFDACMEKQKSTARAARKETNYMGKDASVYDKIDPSITCGFIGYTDLKGTSEVKALVSETDTVTSLAAGERGTIIVSDTPFYATKGGQIGDAGTIEKEDFLFEVEDTISLSGEKVGHVGVVKKGSVSVGDTVELAVDAARRRAIARNHSATHLLQRALREVLGEHVQQAGSDVNPERLRFDFTHFSAMSPDEIEEVERRVNDRIAAAVDVKTQVMSLAEARESGAMALFGEKYGDEVRVVSMGEYSTELCGGTHVANTSDISAFKLLSESGVASGVRRIEALTGAGVLEYYHRLEKAAQEAAALLKTSPEGLAERIRGLQKEIKALHQENESLKSAKAKDALGDIGSSSREIAGLTLIAKEVADVDMNGLRTLGDELKQGIGEGMIVLASAQGGKVSLMAMATDGAIAAGAHAGNLIKAIAGKVGGGGGGRPNMAQAGGKNPAGIADALEEAVRVFEGMVG
ncbi:MAG: alanine--tRNA ligase, partial [Lachnospiraceae bacterium]|nr:alanine--tRNA ligase [Lachnospiraceae bacterium]